MSSIQFNGQTYSEDILNLLSSSSLVELYNQIADSKGQTHVSKFSDKQTAVRRVWLALGKIAMHEADDFMNLPIGENTMSPYTIEEFIDDIKKTDKVILDNLPDKREKPRKARGRHFVFPLGDIKQTNEKTLRSKVRDRLRGGATFEQVVEVVKQFDIDRGVAHKNVERRAYEAIRIVHYYLGYGLKQDADGVITLVESKL